MNYRAMNLAIFKREAVPHVFFQPRIEPWFHWHEIFNQLPDGYHFAEMIELFDALDCSMRYVHYYTGMPDPVVRVFDQIVKVDRKENGDRATTVYETPFGDLTEVQHYTVDKTWRTVDFAVKIKEDLRALTWLCEHTRFHFDADAFRQGSVYMGPRGEPQFWVPKSPYQSLAQIWMKLPDLVYALVDFPDAVEAAMAAIDRSYDQLYTEIIESGLVNIVNFGENIHEQLLSPRYLESYLIPFWEKRVEQLHGEGIFSHIHIDGYFKHMLPYLNQMPFDGIEALTPIPQGDMTLEEINQNLGNKILLDGIPAVLFLDTYSEDILFETTEKIIKLFRPNLILGISDELPQGAGVESIERVRKIAELCKNL